MAPRHFALRSALHCVRTHAMTDLIGTTEAVKILGVHPSTITRWVKAGRITPATKLPAANGALLFNRADIEALKEAS